MGEEKEILLRGKVCAYLTCRLMGDPYPCPLSLPLSFARRNDLISLLESADILALEVERQSNSQFVICATR